MVHGAHTKGVVMGISVTLTEKQSGLFKEIGERLRLVGDRAHERDDEFTKASLLLMRYRLEDLACTISESNEIIGAVGTRVHRYGGLW